MKLKPLFSGLWTVYAVVSSTSQGDRCQIEDFLQALPDAMIRHGIALTQMLEHVANNPSGPRQLPDTLSHYIDKNEKIWEFIKGRLRIAWFYDENQIIVCCHGFVKDSQRTKETDKARAIAAKRAYFAAKVSRRIEIVPEA